jgi:Bacterial protein of unknown function (HtrL_YibB)
MRRHLNPTDLSISSGKDLTESTAKQKNRQTLRCTKSLMMGLLLLIVLTLVTMWTGHGTEHQVMGEATNLPQRQQNQQDIPKVNMENIPEVNSLANTVQPLQSSNATVVTAYFSLTSKFPKENYDKWMANMLSLQDNMVIYTSPDLVPHMQAHRAHAPDKTVVIGMDITDLPLGKDYSAKFWEQQLTRDPEKKRHRSYELFWVWLSKSWFVTDAIHRNYFDSMVYIWSDIGCFRDQKWKNRTMMVHYEVLPENSTIQMAHHETIVPPYVWWNNKYAQKSNFYHSGSQMAAYQPVWNQWHKEYMKTIKGFLERNMFIGEDQTVAQSTCLRVPSLCQYVPTSQVTDNHYFGLRSVLHYGGTYSYWRPPDDLPLEPEDAQEKKLYQV